MEATLPWYGAMPAEDRSWVNLVAQAGIAAFVDWFRDPRSDRAISADVFGTAPRELARAVTLQQTVELVRVTIAVVEEGIEQLAEPGDQALLRESVLHYSREVAFAAAQVYAQAAEARGAWDARLEALVVDALLRAEADEAVRSRAAALGWRATDAALAVVGTTPAGEPEAVIDEVHRAARAAGADALAAVQGERLVVVLGAPAGVLDDPRDQIGAGGLSLVRRLSPAFGPGPVVVGPLVADLLGAGDSARAALAGLQAAPAWPGAPRPVLATELLPERALAGDTDARRTLVEGTYAALAAAGPALGETLAAYLEHAGSLEGAARMLFVHPNTVRYRLRRVAELTGYAPAEPRDAFALRLALALGRLAEADEAPPGG
ncbi:PucR family transcriptional regulator [Motilibacter sp. E257]|uniref:PucR family transcriptional regulator n=2 Tax=Motilibacter deserti TaxID=2714956 RepID=A0ABX0GS49_9ACTN|nr:PucR family transcriptional regulator [Motilibacter deserti]